MPVPHSEEIRRCILLFLCTLDVGLCKEIFARKHTATHKPTSAQPLRPGSHGCKIFEREALQFPWILQQNLEAAARSAEKREAARRAASRAAAAEKSAGCSSCNVRMNVRSRSSGLVFSFFLFIFFFWKRELSRQMRTFSSSAAIFKFYFVGEERQ